MASWNWTKLCGRADANFTVWDKNDFGHCFEQIVFACAAHILLAVVSAYHFSRHHGRRLRGPVRHSPTLYVRFAASLVLVAAPLLTLALVYLYEEFHPSMIDVITWCIKALSWAIHSGFVWRLRRYYHIHIRGTISTVLSYFSTALSLAVQLRTLILHVEKGSNYFSVVEEYLTFIAGVAHFIYSLSLIPSKRPRLTQSQEEQQTINSSLQTDRLLDSGQTQYGSISPAIPRQDLGTAEDGANCLSRLSFWWVQSLMKKGSKGTLKGPQDLFHLPRRLRTEKIEQIFRDVLASHSRNKSQDTDSQPQEGERRPLLTSTRRGNHETSAGVLPDVDIRTGSGSPVQSNPGVEQEQAKKVSLIRSLNKAFGCEFYSLGVLKLVGDSLGFAGPMLLNLMVKYMENSDEPAWHGYAYAGGLFLGTFLSAMCLTHFNYCITTVGLKIRAAIITTIYRKTLVVSSVSLAEFSTGQIVNFMSTDTDRIVNFCPSFHAFWSLPIQTGVSLYLLYLQVGWAFLAGLGFTILLIPINRWIAIKIGQLSTSMMTQKDARVKLMNEILCGIRVIKFYAWESRFATRIDRLRQKELKSLKGRKYLDAMCVFFWATTPVLISILTFMTYSLLGNQLTAAKVFTSMALFNMLIVPLNSFPWVLNGLVESWVSIQRLQAFIHLTDLDWKQYYSQTPVDPRPDVTVQISGGTFSWFSVNSDEDGRLEGEDADSQNHHPDNSIANQDAEPGRQDEDEQGMTSKSRTLMLQDVNITIEEGMFVGIVGKVGMGKSSLFSALLAEMGRQKGAVWVRDLQSGFGLATQEPWIQHATVRENILFGQTFNADKYESVLDACALLEDLKVLPAGDRTEIGENGVTLSGGQKARISLARAVYQDKATYLLDDPLAAVDAHVAQHLYTQCIMGLLRYKTRILCTHHTKFLREADVVLVMDQGRVSRCGPPDEVLSATELGQVVRQASANDSADPCEEKPPTASDDLMNTITGTGSDSLVQEEEKESGVVKLHVYTLYWRAVGVCLAPLVLLALLLMQGSRNVNDWWLSYWVSHSHSHGHQGNATSGLQETWLLLSVPHQQYRVSLALGKSSHWTNITEAEDNIQFYLMVYGILAAANSVFTFARAFLFAYGGICAATGVHKDLLASILKAPISFFDVTPIGRILNRFSSDVYAVDDSLPFILNIFLAQLYGVLGTLVITCYGLPWFCVILLPLGIIYYFIQKYYRHTSREIKRITSVTLSPVYAHFSETISGLTTIRALRHMDRFQQENKDRLEANQRAQFAGLAASQWLGIRLQMIGVTMVTGVALIAVMEHHFRSVNAALVGLAMSYALSVTSLLSGVISAFTETEKQMVSVERACQYISDVPWEKQWYTLNVPPYWPIQGAVQFQNVHLQYRQGLPDALDGVCFETRPAEKIGIVGRTGSGKSSLFLALFRMVEIKAGQITIDGISVGHLPLDELRSRLAIIPQDPFLFSGTVRENLDLGQECSDRQLWEALERCHLRDPVERLGGLAADIAERGRHFSVGQRQLMCLARALLTRAKVLCIDEATASVDQQTDRLIQQTIRTEFADNTVLTVAHRINTVLDSDRVLVMHNGKAAEFESPQTLLENNKSLFYGLVHGSS